MNIQKPIIRSSSLPMFMSCSNATLNPHGLPRVETENEVAFSGTLVHGVCENLVKTGELTLPALKARLSEADYDRASMQVSNFLKVWNEAKHYMMNPETEYGFSVELSHAVITGHIDLHHTDPLRAFILDYKTGRQHEEHYHQMAAYAYGVWDKVGRPANYTVYVSVIYLEDNAVHPYEFTASDLVAWEQEIAVQVMQPRYTVGRKCAFCTLQDGCPAYRMYATNAIRSLVQLHESEYSDPPAWADLDPEQRGEIIDRMYVVDKALDRVRLSLRNHVKSKGAVDIGDGKEYALVEQEERQINLPKALKILENRIGSGQIVSNARLALDTVLAAYAGKAAKGRKTQAKKELFAELDAAGAIVRSTTTKMWRRPKGEKVME